MPGDFDGLFDGSDSGATAGVLEVSPEGWGLLHPAAPGADVYVPRDLVQTHGLQTGDRLAGRIRRPKETERHPVLVTLGRPERPA